ncbi:MAG: hypothetical protein KAR20_03210 [Candidatus Heimdallarchaeota archaeon]|nr:hypothetical protein [Candidatus Heimdallarchaeota archaeon]
MSKVRYWLALTNTFDTAQPEFPQEYTIIKVDRIIIIAISPIVGSRLVRILLTPVALYVLMLLRKSEKPLKPAINGIEITAIRNKPDIRLPAFFNINKTDADKFNYSRRQQ